jgi:hypothetical protein
MNTLIDYLTVPAIIALGLCIFVVPFVGAIL